ncbi:MAG: DUF892 family protein, partial [Acidobacteria bacterium]
MIADARALEPCFVASAGAGLANGEAPVDCRFGDPGRGAETMPKIDSLEPLMVEELRDILDAEKQVQKALPKMAKAASSQELRNAFKEHQQQTTGQIERLNRVFDELGERPRGKKCEGMKALIDEGQTMMKET